MANEINIEQLASHLRAARGKRGLREVAQEIGEVSSSTLSRVEQGKLPDLDTFIRICRWLGVPTETFIINSLDQDAEVNSLQSQVSSFRRVVDSHLRADKTLEPKTAKALKSLIDLALQAIEDNLLDNDEDTET